MPHFRNVNCVVLRYIFLNNYKLNSLTLYAVIYGFSVSTDVFLL
jgi:hypothetical protein